MIAGLPVATWVLMAVSVVPGIVLVVMAHRAHRGDLGGAPPDDRRPPRGPDNA